MRRSLISLAILTALGGMVAGGCHRRLLTTIPTAAHKANEEHCFWTAFRTTLPPDTVASRYVQAFTSLGLSAASASHLADTAWANAGPTVIAFPEGRNTYAARVVAYRRGDTTLYRAFVTVTAPPGGWSTPDDSGHVGARTIPFCGRMARAAQVHGTTSGMPGALEVSEVWRSRPRL